MAITFIILYGKVEKEIKKEFYRRGTDFQGTTNPKKNSKSILFLFIQLFGSRIKYRNS